MELNPLAAVTAFEVSGYFLRVYDIDVGLPMAGET